MTDLPITVLGAGGWIGSALVQDLRRRGNPVQAVQRNDVADWLRGDTALGPVIYAIGLTADFRERPHDTIEAHVSLLSRVLQRRGLERLVYLSSTRVYSRSNDTDETAALPCLSSDPSDLYNLSKLMGEALVLQDPRPGLRAVRLSNVLGPGQPPTTFVGELLLQARGHGRAVIRQEPESSKDYVALADVVRLLPLLACRARHRLYNLGSGINTSHRQLASWLQQQGVVVQLPEPGQGATAPSFAVLRMARLRAEFEPPGDALAQRLPCDNRSMGSTAERS